MHAVWAYNLIMYTWVFLVDLIVSLSFHFDISNNKNIIFRGGGTDFSLVQHFFVLGFCVSSILRTPLFLGFWLALGRRQGCCVAGK